MGTLRYVRTIAVRPFARQCSGMTHLPSDLPAAPRKLALILRMEY